MTEIVFICMGVAEKPNWRTDQPYNAMMLTPICINRNTQHPEAAWTFVQYLCGKQGAATLAENLVLPAYEDESIRGYPDTEID